MRAPKQLGPNGRRLWRWLDATFDGLEDHQPLALELCILSDRLWEVRRSIEQNGVWLDGKKNPLVDVEVKLHTAFARAWKLLGLNDDPPPPARPVGRPPQ